MICLLLSPLATVQRCAQERWVNLFTRPSSPQLTDISRPQKLGLAEPRAVMIRLIWRFDITLCKESESWMTGQKAFMVWEKPKLWVKLSARQSWKIDRHVKVDHLTCWMQVIVTDIHMIPSLALGKCNITLIYHVSTNKPHPIQCICCNLRKPHPLETWRQFHWLHTVFKLRPPYLVEWFDFTWKTEAIKVRAKWF